MNYQEAVQWMNNERDMCNIVPRDPIETWVVRTEQANAAKLEQAYWVIRYHKELKDK